jgi:hypothetical protein
MAEGIIPNSAGVWPSDSPSASIYNKDSELTDIPDVRYPSTFG